MSFVSVHLAAEVNQAAEDEKEAAECWALSSWSRVCSLHGQRFLDTSRHTLHEFTKLILKRYPIISHHTPSYEWYPIISHHIPPYPIISHHIPSYPVWPQNQMFHIVSWCFYFLPVFALYNSSISKPYTIHIVVEPTNLKGVRLIAWGHAEVMLRSMDCLKTKSSCIFELIVFQLRFNSL